MEPLNIESLLAEITPDSPCGEDLESHGDFLKLEKCSEDWIKQKVHPSQNGVKESDWKTAHKQALDLFAQTKDLRVAVYLTQARTIQEGLPGFRDALDLLYGLADRYWESLHPLLDPDDDNDPTQRLNTLESLCHPHSVLDDLRRQPLVEVKGVGRFSFRDVQMAKGEIRTAESGDEDGAPEVSSLDLIRGAFMETPWEALNDTQRCVQESRARLADLKTLVESKIESGKSLDFSALDKTLHEMNGFLQERIDARPESQAQAGNGNGGTRETASSGGQPSVHGMAYSGDIKSREDVVTALEKICDYYDRYEPSSPLPILLRRAKRLVSKNFVEIIQDLSPDGLKQVEQISGEDYSSEE